MAPAESAFGRYALEFFANSKGLKTDLEKLELQTTKSATAIEKSLSTGFNKGVAASREAMGGLVEKAGGLFGRLAGFISSPIGAITTLAATVGTFLVSSIADAVEFDKAFERVRLQLLGTAQDMDQLKGRLLTLTPSMATASETAAAMGQALAVGYSTDEAMKLLDIASKLSRVTGVDLSSSLRLLTESLRGYGLGVADAERISNILLTTLQKAGGPAGAENVIVGLARIIPVAHELAIPLEQVTAALATMQQQGIEGGRATMALSMILARAAGDAQKFRDANIDIGKVAREEGIPGILKAIRTISGGSFEDLHKVVGDARTLNVMLALSGEAAGRFAENLKAAGALDLSKQAEQITSMAKAEMDLATAWSKIKERMGAGFVPPLAAAARGGAAALEFIAGPEGPRTSLRGVDIATELREAAKGLAPLQAQVKEGADAATQALTKEGQAVKEILLPAAQRASMREMLELGAKAWSERLKQTEDATVKQIQLDKQLAEARKVTGAELLQYDRRILETQLQYGEEGRQERLKAIAEELPLLDQNNAAEKKLLLTLKEERSRLQQDSLNEQANYQKQLTLLAEKETAERRKIQEAEFDARKTRGEVSLQDEIDEQRRRAQIFAAGSPERIKAEDQAFKLASDMADRLFAHEEALGLKSLQDKIDFEKKAEAAVKSSTQQMDAMDKQYKFEEDRRNKRQSAALGILGEVKERLEAKGYGAEYITRADVEREMLDIQAERARQAGEAQRFAAGGGMSLEEVIAGYQAAGKLGAAQKRMGELGGVGEILAGGAQVEAGPLTESLGMLGFGITQPLAGMDTGIGTVMDKSYTALDEGLTKMEQRVEASGDRIKTTFYQNLEEWFVKKLMQEAMRD